MLECSALERGFRFGKSGFRLTWKSGLWCVGFIKMIILGGVKWILLHSSALQMSSNFITTKLDYAFPPHHPPHRDTQLFLHSLLAVIKGLHTTVFAWIHGWNPPLTQLWCGHACVILVDGDEVTLIMFSFVIFKWVPQRIYFFLFLRSSVWASDSQKRVGGRLTSWTEVTKRNIEAICG